MNYLLHRHRSPGKVIPVPDELKELMSEMSREVLRAQPSNVINFLADYLEDKLVRRENQCVAGRVVDTVLDTSLDIIEMLDEIGMDEDRAERAVQMIREAFRKHFHMRTSDESLRDAFREGEVLRRLVEECGFTQEQAKKASRIIERAYKTYFLRNVYKEYHGPAETSDWQDAAKHTLGIYAEAGASKEEMERAAVRIQAAYRGYYTRKRRELDRGASVIQKSFRKHLDKQVVRGVLDQVIEDVIDPKFSAREEVMRIVDMVLKEDPDAEKADESEINAAALKIQSVFRGKRTRKAMERKITEIPLEPVDQPQSADTPNDNLQEVVTSVQSLSRGHPSRQSVQTEQAAIKIQSLARGHLARKRRSQNQQDQK